jgi:diaminohydroxyphosphoribosylaminopyrimidine deaminase / 5-amino-6-(5-phosphoribosylamino)uracil reductase
MPRWSRSVLGKCTDAILAAGIARVVYALADPNEAAAGGGDQLSGSGLDVESGVLAEEAVSGLGPWATAVSRKRPYVTWKYAATLDGRTAAADGTSRWISGEAARVDVHRQRSHVDAVIVGIGTVLADDPQLAVRDWPTTRQPLRVVVDGGARTPLAARILDGAAETLIAVGDDVDEVRVGALRAAGAGVIRLPRPQGRLALDALLGALYDRDVLITFVEGGATLAGSFMRAGLVDRVVGYHAPMLLGAGRPVMIDIGASTLADAVRLDLTEVTRIGNDVRIVADVRAGDDTTRSE